MIEVITGPMFSGKSTELFDIINTLESLKCTYQVFKPSKDKRDTTWLRARTTTRLIEATVISDLSEIKNKIKPNTEYILIDEVQFLTGDVKELIKLDQKGYKISCAGLSLTSELEPFGLMPNILAVADSVIQLYAECAKCGKHNATFTATNEPKDKTAQIRFGDSKYYPVCLDCLEIND